MRLLVTNIHLGLLFGTWIGVRQLHKTKGRSKAVCEIYK